MGEDSKIVELKIEEVLPNRFQPRINFDEEDLTALANSIREHGVLQPITVRPLGNKYEIIMGERRFKASKLAGLKTIPAIVKNMSDNDSAEVALVENIQRQDLTAIEEAICYKRILDAGYLTQESLAIKLGKTQSTVANKLRLLSLDEEVQHALLDKRITERHARSLLKVSDKNAQRQLLKRIIEERLTVRKTDEEIDKMNKEVNTDITNKPIDLNDIEIIDFDDKDATASVKPNNEVVSDNNFNIPTSPIIEEENTNPQSEIKYSFLNNPMESEQAEKPGFMNVDNIMANAKDINISNETKDLNSMFLPPKIETDDDNDGNEKSDDLLRPGQFINIFNDDDKKDEKAENTDVANENFDFNSYFAPVFADDNNNATTQPKPTEPVKIVVENPQPVMAPEFEEPTPVITPAVEPVMEPINEISEVKPIDIYKGPTEDQINTIAEKKPNNIVSKDIRLVINTIRECADRLEDAGYIVDLEEIDFEDSYQAIFKISKK